MTKSKLLCLLNMYKLITVRPERVIRLNVKTNYKICIYTLRCAILSNSVECLIALTKYVMTTTMSLLFISGCYRYRSTKKLFVQSSWKLNSDVLTSLLDRTTPTQLPHSNGLIIWSSVKTPQLFKKGIMNNQNVWNGFEASFCLKYSSVRTK